MTPTIAARGFIDSILDDHFAIRALLQGADMLVPGRSASGETGTAELRALLHDLDARLVAHEARESRLLFPRLQMRCLPLGSVLGRMEQEHTQMATGIGDLLALLPDADGWRPRDAGDASNFAQRWHSFSATTQGHMNVEERYILPVAADFLSRDDWDDITS